MLTKRLQIICVAQTRLIFGKPALRFIWVGDYSSSVSSCLPDSSLPSLLGQADSDKVVSQDRLLLCCITDTSHLLIMSRLLIRVTTLPYALYLCLSPLGRPSPSHFDSALSWCFWPLGWWSVPSLGSYCTTVTPSHEQSCSLPKEPPGSPDGEACFTTVLNLEDFDILSVVPMEYLFLLTQNRFGHYLAELFSQSVWQTPFICRSIMQMTEDKWSSPWLKYKIHFPRQPVQMLMSYENSKVTVYFVACKIVSRLKHYGWCLHFQMKIRSIRVVSLDLFFIRIEIQKPLTAKANLAERRMELEE